MTDIENLQVTADLVEDTDQFDLLPPHSAFRRPSPDAGVIGQPSPSLYSSAPGGPRGFYMSKAAMADDVDVAALIASAHRQHEADKEKSRWAAAGNGNGVGTTTSMMKGLSIDGNDGRWGYDWDRATAPMSREQDWAVPLPIAAPTGPPKTAPIYPFSSPHLGNGIPNVAPIGAPPPASPFSQRAIGTPPVDVHAQIGHHLTQLQALISPALVNSDECEKLRKEVEMWKGEWSKGEREKKRLEGVIQGLEERQVPAGPGFTAVLIDGDGLIFQDAHLQGGFTGGQKAAKALLTALPALAAHTSSPKAATGSVDLTVDSSGAVINSETGERQRDGKKELGSVVVMVFLNKSGLGTTLVKAGIIGSWGVFDAFWQGFSAAHELFTVIDVGPGKEATDAKIREYLKLYAKNAQCEMIVLGASHDNGYANILSSLQTESRLSKLLLLKGYNNLAPQLRQYSDRVVSIPDLFRTTKVPASFSSIVQSTSSSTATEHSVPSPPGPVQAKNLKKVEEAVAADSTSESGSELSEVVEWSEVKSPKRKPLKAIGGAANAQVKNKDGWMEAGKGKKGKRYKDEKATGGGGSGKGKKGKNSEKVGTVRHLTPRPCHTYYLSPWGCKVGDECDYGHHYQLDDKQINELAKLAKEMLCPFAKGNKCHFDEDECVYGHKCPRMEHCGFGDTCRFKVLPNGHGELD